MGNLVTDFPKERLRHHFFPGVYAKEVHIPAGATLVSHKHTYDHMSVLAVGLVIVTVNGVSEEYCGPAVLNIRAGLNHEVKALTESVWFCVHATEETDENRVDSSLISVS